MEVLIFTAGSDPDMFASVSRCKRWPEEMSLISSILRVTQYSRRHCLEVAGDSMTVVRREQACTEGTPDHGLQRKLLRYAASICH